MDIAVFLVMLLTISLGIYRGFFRELLGLLTLGFSVLVAKMLSPSVETLVLTRIESEFLASVIAYVATFGLAFMGFAILFYGFKRLLRKGRDSTSTTDKVLGGVLGGAKGYSICLLAYFVIYSFSSVLHPEYTKVDKFEEIEEITPNWLKDSKSYPVFFHGIAAIDKALYLVLPQKPDPKPGKDLPQIQSPTTTQTIAHD